MTGYLARTEWPHAHWDPAFPTTPCSSGQHAALAWLSLRQTGPGQRDHAGLLAAACGTLTDALPLRRLLGAPCSALGQLRGAFALAILDPQRRQALLAVDRFAIENLYYVADAEGLAFATSATQLAHHPLVQQRFRLQSLYDALYYHCLPAPDAGYTGMRRLAPGHFLRWQEGRWDAVPYPLEASSPVPAAELAGALRARLRQAVAQALPADSPACFLSGGLDSSTVTGLCSELRPGSTVACTIGFDVEGYDEMRFARAAARHFRVRHLEHYLRPEDVIADLPAIVSAFDAPFGNASAVPAYACARLAANHGHSTILAGDGGDELFGGNARYARQLLFERYRRLPEWFRLRVMAPVAAGLSGKAASFVKQVAMPLPERLMRWNLLEVISPGSFLSPAVLAEVDQAAPLDHLRRCYAAAAGHDGVDRMLRLDWRLTLADNDLPKVTRTCALAGIKVRFPMLDPAVVALAAQLPSAAKVGLRGLRPFYRRTFARFLPPGSLDKSKQGFGMPVGNWLASHPALRAYAAEELRWLEQLGVLRSGFRAELLGPQLKAHPAYFGTLAWVLMTLSLWLRQTRVSLVP